MLINFVETDKIGLLGVFVVFSQLMLFGRVLTDGRLNARLKCDLSENLTLKGSAHVLFWFLFPFL